jgi:hypothetical protein
MADIPLYHPEGLKLKKSTKQIKRNQHEKAGIIRTHVP